MCVYNQLATTKQFCEIVTATKIVCYFSNNYSKVGRNWNSLKFFFFLFFFASLEGLCRVAMALIVWREEESLPKAKWPIFLCMCTKFLDFCNSFSIIIFHQLDSHRSQTLLATFLTRLYRTTVSPIPLTQYSQEEFSQAQYGTTLLWWRTYINLSNFHCRRLCCPFSSSSFSSSLSLITVRSCMCDTRDKFQLHLPTWFLPLSDGNTG